MKDSLIFYDFFLLVLNTAIFFLPGTPNNQFEMIKLMFGETTISYLMILYPPIETAIYKWMAIRSQVYTI